MNAPATHGVELPRQVREQIERANAMEATLRGGGQPPAEPGGDGQPGGGTGVAAPPPPNAAGAQDGALTAEQAAELREQLRVATERYNALQGMYKSERRRADQMSEQLKQALAAPPKQEQKAEPAQPTSASAENRKRRIELLGEDVVTEFEAMQAEAVHTATAPLLAEIERLKAVGQGRQPEIREHPSADPNSNAAFEAKVAAQFPAFHAVVNSHEFNSWINSHDNETGLTIADLLNAAWDARNLDRVLLFLNRYQHLFGDAPAAHVRQPEPKPKAPADQSADALAARVLPAATGTSGTHDPAPSKTRYKAAVLNEWMRKKAQHTVNGERWNNGAFSAYRGTQDEFQALSREFEAAMREGRIDP